MSVDGPEGPGRIGSVPPKEIKQGESLEGTSFEDLLDGKVDPAQDGAAASMDGISAQVQAGDLTGPQAAELLIEATVQKMGKLLEPALRKKIQLELRRLMNEDPVLADKVKQLSGG